jgi:predicted ATPase
MFNLYLNNYRSFLEQEFRFSKINILIGENNSGKTSLLYFLRLLKQTLIIPNGNLNLIGPYINLGTYESIIYNHEKNRNIRFDFEFESGVRDLFLNFFIISKTPEKREIERKIFQEKLSIIKDYSNKISIELTEHLDKHSEIKTIITNKSLGTLEVLFPPELIAKVPPGDVGDYCSLKYHRNIDGKVLQLDNISYTLHSCLSLVGGSSLYDICKKIDETDNLFYEIAYLLLTQNYFREQMMKINFINPITSAPLKYYQMNPPTMSSFSNNLQDFLDVLGNMNEAELENFKAALNEIIREYGIADEIDFKFYDDLDIAVVKVKIVGIWYNLTEIGYGVAMQLPVILGSMMYKNSIILLEQPEVHLYGNLISKLIEILINRGKDTIFFIETHSEYVIRELQILVKEKKVDSEDISIHYLTRNKEKTVVEYYHIKENGAITPVLPDSFFNKSFQLAKQLLK